MQSLELTIQTLGRYIGQLVEHNPDLELPSEVRRMLQQLDDLERQRRKPVFADRKIGKSISVNSHLGFPLKVLEELSERDELGSPQKQKKEKTPFFEQLRQQQQQLQQQRNNHNNNTNNSNQHHNNNGNMSTNHVEPPIVIPPTPPTRPNRLLDNASARSVMQTKLDELRLPEHVDKFVANIKSPLEVDSGVGTPLSPPSTASNASNASSNSSGITTGSIFSRMGYKTTPASLSPLATRQPSMAAIALEEEPTAATIPVSEPEPEPTPLMHPLSMVGGDVNVRFKGTTQLKSIRPVHHMRAITLPSTESEPGVVAAATAGAATAAAAAATATATTATGRS